MTQVALMRLSRRQGSSAEAGVAIGFLLAKHWVRAAESRPSSRGRGASVDSAQAKYDLSVAADHALPRHLVSAHHQLSSERASSVSEPEHVTRHAAPDQHGEGTDARQSTPKASVHVRSFLLEVESDLIANRLISGYSRHGPFPSAGHGLRHQRPVDPVLLRATGAERERRGDQGPHGSHRRGHYRSP